MLTLEIFTNDESALTKVLGQLHPRKISPNPKTNPNPNPNPNRGTVFHGGSCLVALQL